MKSLTENDILDLYRYFCWSTAPTPVSPPLRPDYRYRMWSDQVSRQVRRLVNGASNNTKRTAVTKETNFQLPSTR